MYPLHYQLDIYIYLEQIPYVNAKYELVSSVVPQPKFKIGNEILDMISRKYEIEDVDFITKKYTIKGHGIWDINYIDNNFTLAPTAATAIINNMFSKPIFNVADIITTQWNNELAITTVDTMYQTYYYRIIKSNNPLKIGTTDTETFEKAHANWKSKVNNTEENKTKASVGNKYGCECGQWKVGNTKASRMHSGWCPIYKE